MITYFDKLFGLMFIVLFCLVLIILNVYRDWEINCGMVEDIDPPPTDDVPVRPNPILTDLIADLFMGKFSGYVLSVIDKDEREFLYYKQLHEMMSNRFVTTTFYGGRECIVDSHVFESIMISEISKIAASRLQHALRRRLDILTEHIKSSPYYKHINAFELQDITTAMDTSFAIIARYNLIENKTAPHYSNY